MLVNMSHVLRYAEGKQCRIGAFDMLNLETLMAVTRAAERHEGPVITQHAQLHECEVPIHITGLIMVCMAREARVPIRAILDHGESLDYMRKVLGLGFSVVMYNSSSLAYEESVVMAREVVAMARAYNADVEAKTGIVTGYEGKAFVINDVSDACTDLKLAARYVKDMGIDALVTSVETIHGFYATKPRLDFDRIVKVKELTGLSLVVHGGSNINITGIQRVIRCDTCKISYSSYTSNADMKVVKKLLEEKKVKYFYDLADAAVDATEQDVLNVISMFALE